MIDRNDSDNRHVAFIFPCAKIEETRRKNNKVFLKSQMLIAAFFLVILLFIALIKQASIFREERAIKLAYWSLYFVILYS